LTAAAAGEAAWFGGAKREAEPGCERSERRVLADARSVSARTPAFSCCWKPERSAAQRRLEAVSCKALFGRAPRQVCGPQCAPHTYWITSSARRSSDGGIVIPRAWAVLRLMISSNVVGCSTGKSAGLAPFRILSTYVAPRRYPSGTLAQ
jgi:hypothetical protein